MGSSVIQEFASNCLLRVRLLVFSLIEVKFAFSPLSSTVAWVAHEVPQDKFASWSMGESFRALSLSCCSWNILFPGFCSFGFSSPGLCGGCRGVLPRLFPGQKSGFSYSQECSLLKYLGRVPHQELPWAADWLTQGSVFPREQLQSMTGRRTSEKPCFSLEPSCGVLRFCCNCSAVHPLLLPYPAFIGPRRL